MTLVNIPFCETWIIAKNDKNRNEQKGFLLDQIKSCKLKMWF